MSGDVSRGQLKFSLRYFNLSSDGGSIGPVLSGVPKLAILASCIGITLMEDVSVTSPATWSGFKKIGYGFVLVTTTNIMLLRKIFVMASSMKTPSIILLCLVMTREPGHKIMLSGHVILHLTFMW